MLFGHSRPTGVTYSVSGTGAAIVSPIAQIDDNRPDTVTRFQWLSGTQTTASVFRLRMDWTGAIVPRLVGLSNISLPEGTKIAVAFRRSSDTAGTYPYAPTMFNAGQRIVAGPRGEQTWWILLPAGATAVVGAEIQIYNDVNGAAAIAASANFTIGEAGVWAADEAPIQPGANMEEIDTTTDNYSTNRQPYTNPGTIYRQLTFKLVAAVKATYFDTYRALFAKLDRGKTGVYVELYEDSAGTFSADLLHQNAMLGIVTKLPGAPHKAGKLFESNTVVVVETPIPT